MFVDGTRQLLKVSAGAFEFEGVIGAYSLQETPFVRRDTGLKTKYKSAQFPARAH